MQSIDFSDELQKDLELQRALTDFESIYYSFSIQPQTVKDSFFLCAGLTSSYNENYRIQHHVNVYRNALHLFSKLNLLEKGHINYEEYKLLFEIVSCASLIHHIIYKKNMETNELKSKMEKLDNFLKTNVSKFENDIKWIIENIFDSIESNESIDTNNPNSSNNKSNKHENKLIQLAKNIILDAHRLADITQNQ